MEIRIEKNRIIVITKWAVHYCDYSGPSKAVKIAEEIKAAEDPVDLSLFGKFIQL